MHHNKAKDPEATVAEKLAKPRKKAHRGRFFLVGLIIGLVLAFGGSIYLANSNLKIPWLGGNGSTQRINVTVLQESMQANNELSTASYQYTDMVTTEDINNLSAIGLPNIDVPFSKATYVLQFDGTIKAGFDLNQATVTTEGMPGYETVVVTLPQPQILSHETGGVSCVYKNESILNPLHAGEESTWLDEQKQTMEQRATDAGLFEEAKTNATATFETAFKDIIPEGSSIEVRFAEDEEAAS